MTVRVAFLGCGFIAGYHAGMLRAGAPDGFVVTAAYDPDRARAEAFAAVHGGVAVDGEDEAIAAADAVYVTTWTSEHRRLVEAAAGAGRAVFCEKPLAATGTDAAAMVAAAEDAGIVNQVGLVLRDSPSFLLLRHLVQRPVSGRIQAVVFRDDQYLPVQGIYGSTWRGDVARAGAGTLLEHSIHDLDLLRWIVGPVVDVAARTGAFHGLPGIEDVAAVTLGFAGGALATLTSVWHDVLARPSLRHVEVFCERATYVLEGDVAGPVRWTVEGSGGAPFTGTGMVQAADLVEALRSEHVTIRNPDAAFVAAVAAGTAASPTLADALGAHRLADAAYRSAAGGGVPVTPEP
jgi:UDP-N-acetyl-2-amino-2-deoxyglucuronate dehydrogenase